MNFTIKTLLEKMIIHHKHFLGDVKVILPETRSGRAPDVTMFVK